MNSLEFVQKIQNSTKVDDEIMVSFDVKSLFPNVHITRIIEVYEILHNLKTKPKHIEDTKKQMYLRLTNFCMDNCFFTSKWKFYKQCASTAMGLHIFYWDTWKRCLNLNHGFQKSGGVILMTYLRYRES